jgi:hypothetical protein
MKYLRAATDDVYEQARLALDAAWGLPNDKGTDTCISPISIAPRDINGRPMVAVSEEWCEWPPADELLPELIQGGVVAEISEADYKANWPES